MESAHKQILRNNRMKLAQELDIEEVCQMLVEEDVLSDNMVEAIHAEKTNFKRNVAFLNKLPNRGPDAFRIFLGALRETQQRHLSDLLAPGNMQDSRNNTLELSSFPAPSSFSFTSSTPMKNQDPNEMSFSSVEMTSPQCTVRGQKRPNMNHNNTTNVLQSSPKEGRDADFETCPKTPVEHMDAAPTSTGSPSSPDGDASQSLLENLHSSASFQSLISSCGISSLGAKLPNQSVQISVNHSAPANHLDKRFIPSNEQAMQMVTDSPNLNNVTVKGCSPEFFHHHYEDCYSMSNKCRGLAFIVSVINFDPSACLDDRLGGNLDVTCMELLLTQLNYEVYKLNNGTASEIWNSLRNFAAWIKHKDLESTFVVLMSHGHDGIIYGRDGKPIELGKIYNLFSNANCPLLRNKPKVFLVQACRGDDPDKGVDDTDGPIAEKDSSKRRRLDFGGGDDDSFIRNKLPSISDMLIAYATVPGFAAMRNTQKGSWFIQAFIQVMAFHAHNRNLLEIMTMTNNQVKGREGWSPGSEYHRCKEMSVFSCCLCKPLYFFPGLYVTDNTK